jgi:uncharacterized damage-inducible protein DinB
MARTPEAWLRGPIEGVDPHLMPVAHALLQAGEDLERAAAGLSVDELWARPGGAASVGFHLKHIAGVTDRLLTYARGETLSEEQFRALGAEGEAGDPPATAGELIRPTRAALDEAMAQLRRTSPATLLDPREVGRARLPTSVLGLLYHVGEHATRHTGQIITTTKVVRGERG